MGRKKFVPESFIELCPICRQPMVGRLGVAQAATWVCERHGVMEREQQEAIPYRRVTTSLGECVIIDHIDVFDHHSPVRDCQLPVFLDAELATMKALPQNEKQTFWDRRVKAIREELEARKLDSSRDVYGKSWDGKDNE